ncbi:hypothetical protein ELQ90_13715 [Labedella phragmitis]|uniref:Uncharacterized protein n=1 Tax=Labedella phragmitis TaxID=2498849 RepID=A0A3S4D8D8_9MICO|nr:DUF5979 domain-containing protein [Labedella phragmitis]RWZ46506.1 hypothetical protein ELQ90_13715 [Labedella phragmitis]
MRFTSLTRLGSGLGAALLGLTAAAAVPAAASAAELDAIDAIDAVSIVAPNPDDPSAPLSVGQEFTVSAEWSVADDARPGDTFALEFPSPISLAWAQEFDLRDPDGAVVGTCEAAAQSIRCTLGDYVLDHDDVHGALSVHAIASASTDSGELTFETSTGATITAAVPGGGIVADDPSGGPDQIRKFGGIAPDGSSARWAIEVPIEHLLRLGDGVVLTDVYDERLETDLASLSVAYVAPDGWDEWIADRRAESVPRSTGEWTVENHPADHSFDLTFPNPRTAGGWYLVSYSTPLPANAAVGDVFENAVTAAGTTLAGSTVTYVDANGNGSGQSRRSISVTKAVDGDRPAPDVDFLVRVACENSTGSPVEGFPRESPVRAGESVTFPGVPVGAVCTLSEPEDGGADSVAFTPSPIATVTADSPREIELVVTNTFSRTPAPSPTPTPTPAPTVPTDTPTGSSSVPAPSATPSASSDDLARTGADAVVPTVGAAALLLALGAVALLSHRRRAAR